MLDTDICVELIRKQPAKLVKRLVQLSVGDVVVSAITVSELQYGVQKSRNPERNLEALEQFLLPLVIVEYDYAATATYGQIRAYLEKNGTPIGSMDLLIAAHALALEVILVTNNVREVSRVPNLAVEDWLS